MKIGKVRKTGNITQKQIIAHKPTGKRNLGRTVKRWHEQVIWPHI
jgi:hypothetical protein